MEFRKLRADEIDCRIARVTEYVVQILLYKDARCDMNILDEAVGPMNWTRSHTRDNANCIVSVWDSEKCLWVSKEDTGTESNTEKEKGLASDSFKRACFNWGIGRELYTAPTINFKINQCKVTNKKCYDKFSVEKIVYAGNSISELIIRNENTGSRFIYPSSGNRENNLEENKKENGGVAEVLALCEKTETPVEKILERYRVNTIEEMTSAKRDACIQWLRAKV